jgi:hypothetical protein
MWQSSSATGAPATASASTSGAIRRNIVHAVYRVSQRRDERTSGDIMSQ